MKVELRSTDSDGRPREETAVMSLQSNAFHGRGAEFGGYVLPQRNAKWAADMLRIPRGGTALRNALKASMYEQGHLERGRIEVKGTSVAYRLIPEIAGDRTWIRELKKMRKTQRGRTGGRPKRVADRRRTVDWYLRQVVPSRPRR